MFNVLLENFSKRLHTRLSEPPSSTRSNWFDGPNLYVWNKINWKLNNCHLGLCASHASRASRVSRLWKADTHLQSTMSSGKRLKTSTRPNKPFFMMTNNCKFQDESISELQDNDNYKFQEDQTSLERMSLLKDSNFARSPKRIYLATGRLLALFVYV